MSKTPHTPRRPGLSTTAAATALAAAALTALTALTVTACTNGNPLVPGPKKGQVTVGSANFPENVLLADIYASALKAKGVKVGVRFNVGSREVLYQQVQQGSLTVLPEYNGALLAYLDSKTRAATTADINAGLRAKLPASLEILDSSPAEDKNALVVTAATAAKDHLAAIGDLAPYAASMDIGGPPEFKERYQGLPGLKDKYGLTFKNFSSLDTAGPITVKALADGSVQVATLFTTDPNIASHGFKVLADPEQVFTAQNVTPLAYRDSMTPTAVATLNAVSAKLDTAALAGMMAAIMNQKKDIDVVADDWLKAMGMR
ncbi:ABC transporter substrate-binding protein [Catenulispora pinisilvae]|uniref:ABC transporter substrate-binding protein n=1 Tax=Catenulispora pinisilvae TaxID=2705253 RepID=UPI0018911670|nr:ABC transporter substrate-binding protein [Catenulispora pinisilvae]